MLTCLEWTFGQPGLPSLRWPSLLVPPLLLPTMELPAAARRLSSPPLPLLLDLLLHIRRRELKRQQDGGVAGQQVKLQQQAEAVACSSGTGWELRREVPPTRQRYCREHLFKTTNRLPNINRPKLR